MGGGVATRRRLLVTRWVAPVVAVAVLALVVALAGGFRDAPADAGPAAEVGEEIALARWRITVTDVELTDTTIAGSPTDTTLRLHLQVTLTGEESEYSLPTGLVTVIGPDGTALPDGFQVDPQWRSGLDPGIPRDYVLDLSYPARDDDGEQPPLTAVPEQVAVVIRDERYAEGALFGWSWGSADVAAVVTAPVDDVREQP